VRLREHPRLQKPFSRDLLLSIVNQLEEGYAI